MTLDTMPSEALRTDSGTAATWTPAPENNSSGRESTHEAHAVDVKPRTSTAKKAGGKKSKTLELTLSVTGTADGEWRAELKQGASYLARDLAVAAAAVSRAAKELHEDLAIPIDEVIDEARSHQAAKVAALEAELDAARRALAHLE